jgi:UDP-glucose 4-epimerase
MTILITGGAGYIGSHMVHEFVDSGEPMVVLDNLERLPILTDLGAICVRQYRRPDLVSDVIARHGVTAIIHFLRRRCPHPLPNRSITTATIR